MAVLESWVEVTAAGFCLCDESHWLKHRTKEGPSDVRLALLQSTEVLFKNSGLLFEFYFHFLCSYGTAILTKSFRLLTC